MTQQPIGVVFDAHLHREARLDSQLFTSAIGLEIRDDLRRLFAYTDSGTTGLTYSGQMRSGGRLGIDSSLHTASNIVPRALTVSK